VKNRKKSLQVKPQKIHRTGINSGGSSARGGERNLYIPSENKGGEGETGVVVVSTSLNYNSNENLEEENRLDILKKVYRGKEWQKGRNKKRSGSGIENSGDSCPGRKKSREKIAIFSKGASKKRSERKGGFENRLDERGVDPLQ